MSSMKSHHSSKYVLKLVTPSSMCKRKRHKFSSVTSPKLQEALQPDIKRLKKSTYRPRFSVTHDESQAFFEIFDDSIVQEFLWIDACCRVSDKYLIAMVMTYFKRAALLPGEYNRTNFFLALYLANDMEEDEEDFKYEIFPWALGKDWREHYHKFLKQRDEFWYKLQFRAAVSKKCCEEVMKMRPDHYIWRRVRHESHGGAKRTYMKSIEEKEPYPRGPGRSPIPCKVCVKANNSSGYFSDNSLSSDEQIVLQVATSSESSSPDEYFSKKKSSHKRQKTGKKEAGNVGNHLCACSCKFRSVMEVDLLKEDSFDMDKLWVTLR